MFVFLGRKNKAGFDGSDAPCGPSRELFHCIDFFVLLQYTVKGSPNFGWAFENLYSPDASGQAMFCLTAVLRTRRADRKKKR